MTVPTFSLPKFAHSLLEDGEAILGMRPDGEASQEEIEQVYRLLEQVHQRHSLDAPGESPRLDREAGLWGVQAVHWICWMLLDRIQAETSIPEWLHRSEPKGSTPEEHWSVDLSLRFLSQLTSKAVKLSGADPLVDELKNIAHRWPLASIGIDVEEDLMRRKVVLDHPSLRNVYIDRVLARQDEKRSKAEEVAPWIEKAIGPFESFQARR